eukprot:2294664-Prymnesium_polylepis.1
MHEWAAASPHVSESRAHARTHKSRCETECVIRCQLCASKVRLAYLLSCSPRLLILLSRDKCLDVAVKPVPAPRRARAQRVRKVVLDLKAQTIEALSDIVRCLPFASECLNAPRRVGASGHWRRLQHGCAASCKACRSVLVSV